MFRGVLELGKNKKMIVGVLCSLLAFGYTAGVHAEEAAELTGHNLDEILVLGERELLPGGLLNAKARMGILGDKSIMDIPYSQMSLSRKSLELFDDPSLPLANVLQNNPSIRSSTSSPMYSDFSMRGINMNGNHMMLNGIPSLFSQFTTPPSHIIERIDITSGPNAAINGVNMSNNGTDSGATPAPGTINIITKSAPEEPINRYTQTFSGRGNAGEYIDLARRFGKNNEWGLRINGQYMTGELSLPGAEKNEKTIFFNLDHKDEKSATNLFAGHFDLRIDGAQRWFTFKGTASELPTAPNSKMNYDFKETTKWMHGYLAALNHEQKLNDNWSAFGNFGLVRKSGNKYNSNSSLQFDNNGNFTTDNKNNAQNEASKNAYGQIGVKGKFATGAVKHNLSFAIDRSWARYWNAGNTRGGVIGGNLYDGISFLPGFYPLPDMLSTKPQWEETNVGITLTDVLSYSKVDILLAASRKHESFENIANSQKFINNNTLPTYGITYKPTDKLSVYAGHTESFSRGSVVGDSYINKGETLPPVKSKQNEVGVKWQQAGMLNTLSYFDIDQANLIDIAVGSEKLRASDGKNRFKGVELTSVGQLADKWVVTGGVLYLDAKREKTAGGTKDGKFVNGATEWSGTLGFEYKPEAKIGLVGRAVYNGKAFIDSDAADKKTKIPSFVSFDVGVNYQTKINTIPVKLSAMVYNVTNKDYWMGRGGSTTFGLSMPRTLMLSAQFDF